ncbi:hypothetical protein Afil01_45230 [Actinorhabdospora filicis]|uniref:Uncharacterized protein n=1 Tax=Actinorhabdospora filicis TaxID=1785913 RepID=A0A9W6WBM3_9ACTN|nr:hypothetical protein [Actinorhabdospora filicis]GLZ79716.1 hypothetical protein Afil01_45230 [Actinorhabdospora filicis]
MTAINKLADRLLGVLAPKAEASAETCSPYICDLTDCYWYCCTQRGCYRFDTCC